MSREWKPGDVVAFRLDGEWVGCREQIPALMQELLAWWPGRPTGQVGVAAGSATLRFIERFFTEAEVGRLVVIDPEDREQVEQFSAAYLDAAARMDKSHDRSWYDDEAAADQAQAALREFANPAPPKPDEPQGLGAVVLDKWNTRWTRVEAGEAVTRNPWYPEGDPDQQPDEWDAINAVRVLSEGVVTS